MMFLMPYACQLASCSMCISCYASCCYLCPHVPCVLLFLPPSLLCLSQLGPCSPFCPGCFLIEPWDSLSNYVHPGIACLAFQASDWAGAFWGSLSGFVISHLWLGIHLSVTLVKLSMIGCHLGGYHWLIIISEG